MKLLFKTGGFRLLMVRLRQVALDY